MALAIALPAYHALRGEQGSRTKRTRTVHGPAFHFLVVGGSVPMGCPYEERADFACIAAWMLGDRLNDRPIVVKNLAGLGEDSKDELADVRTLLAEEKDPSHAVLLYYTGNNELVRFGSEIDFAKRDRHLFDEPLVKPDEFEAVLRTFEENVLAIVHEARAKGVRTILSTAAENFAWEPDRSVLANPANAVAVRAELDAAEELMTRGDHAGALERWKALLAIEPRFAWAEQRMGDALRALGRFAEARAAYQGAIDDNGAATVATSRHNAILRAIARSEDLPLVDCEALVCAAAPDGLPGFESFWDNCHPTMDGYRVIAKGFAEEVARSFGGTLTRPDPTTAEIEAELGFDAKYVARVTSRMGQYCYGGACLVWNPKTRLRMSRAYLERAATVLGDDVELICSRAVLELFDGDLERSRALWREAIARDPKGARHRLKHKYVRGLLKNLGVEDGARWVEG